MTTRLSVATGLAASLLVSSFMYAAHVGAEERTAQRNSPANSDAPANIAKKVERCRVQRDQTGWWLVDPGGNRFFSLGVCMFNQGSDRKTYDPVKPSYAGWRHYETPEAWSSSNVRRLKSWGFTTIGGWSEYASIADTRRHDLWITPVVPIGARSGTPWFDMWDEKVVRRIDELAKEMIVPFRGDRRVIGYYSDNEIGWWNAILWKMTLEQQASSGQRQRLIQIVREDYHGDWNALVKDFEPENAASWEELNRGGMLWLRPGSNGIRTMRHFLGLVATRYYKLMRDAIGKYDPDALYLGDRYQSFYYPELASAAGQTVDVVSTNLNQSWNDGTFLHSYLDTLHAISGKPLIISEFYMAAAENGSGNQNKVGGFPAVATQRERRDAIANTLRSLARLPYVVGADWFQYYDEPPHGRKKDGEDYNFGLVDIHDRPYTEVTATFASADLAALKSTPSSPSRNAAGGVPPAPAQPLADFQPMIAIKSWDRERGFVPPATEHALGDLYICWSPSALYLAAFVIDIVEPDYYKDGKIPDVDRALWTTQLNGLKPISARVGSGENATINNRAVRIASLSGTYHEVRCVTAIEVPAAQLGKERLAAGDRIRLESTFATHGRANKIEWKGEFVLAK